MSYEGSKEYICSNGHYFICDCYDDIECCPQCNAEKTWEHSIDHTNGINEDDPSTFPALKKEIGSDDQWHTDHHGNNFATQIKKYMPDSSAWELCKDDRFSIVWHDSKRLSNSVQEQDSATDILVHDENKSFCKISLPYPAKRCGMYVVTCNKCGNIIGVPTSGRVDDPRSVTVNCRN